jgi:hypothetical protein
LQHRTNGRRILPSSYAEDGKKCGKSTGCIQRQKKMKNLPPESRNFAENVERIRVAILARRIFFAFGLSESVSVIQA